MSKNREILFRAKAINRIKGREYRTKYKNGDWVYGLLTKHFNEIYELPAQFTNEDEITGIDVDYKTIGQFTGLTDKNGTKIFEGDIAQVSNTNELYEIKFGEYMPNQWYRLMGEYTSDVSKYSLFGLYVKQIKGEFIGEDFVLPTTTELEVIGNIHDNPELLGGDKNAN